MACLSAVATPAVSGLRTGLRRVRYALPGIAGRLLPAPTPAAIRARCAALDRRGDKATVGYFHEPGARPATVADANLAAIATLRAETADVHLSIKAPALGFDVGLVRSIASAAQQAGLTLMFDAHGPALAQPTLALAETLSSEFPATGCALPSRWRRSRTDAARLRDAPMRLRIVKGEWADPDGDPDDAGAAYLDLVSLLAGRNATVGVATHDPLRAEQALALLLAAGTPCELELLRGLPQGAPRAIAKRLGVPVRVYLPFGPDWWRYAIDKVLARPSLLLALR